MTKIASITKEERVRSILQHLDHDFPQAQCALAHANPLELLIATILSAQCTDERVNLVSKDLFQKYRAPEDYARLPLSVLESEIHSTGFYHNKAKNIQGACKMILEKFNGAVPNTMEALLQLPGVARKTANVVLGTAFGKAEGIVVDTHVLRLSQRLEFSSSDKAETVERDLMAIIPKERWISFAHQMILHGRTTCKAKETALHPMLSGKNLQFQRQDNENPLMILRNCLVNEPIAKPG